MVFIVAEPWPTGGTRGRFSVQGATGDAKKFASSVLSYSVHQAAPRQPLRAYGDRDGDGMVQLSFVLELPPSARAREAAKRFAELHGLVNPVVATMEPCAEGFSFFVVYGQSTVAVDTAALDVPEVRSGALSRDEIEHRIKTRLGRKIVVVGACTGSDAHTVGIDAILNYKGYAGDKGLESYKGFDVYNLGAQVENEQLAARARALDADAILVSQVITQRNCHKENGRALVELLAKQQGWRDRIVSSSAARASTTSSRSSSASTPASARGRSPSDVASYLALRCCGPDDPTDR